MILTIFLALFAVFHPKIFSKPLAHRFKQFLRSILAFVECKVVIFI